MTKLRVLNQVAQVGSNELDLSVLIARSLAELERYFPLQVHSVLLVEVEPQSEIATIGSDVPDARQVAPSFLVLADSKSNFAARSAKLALQGGRRFAVEETPYGPCLNGEPAFFADLRQPRATSSPLCEQLAQRGASFLFAAPLRAGNRTVGILQIVSTSVASFTNDHVQTIYLVADLLGPAISNCQLVSRLRTAYAQLRATQDKLVQTEKMRALGELASGVAHNFNNSLCSVLGFLEIAIADPTLPPNIRRHLEASRSGALDAAQTVQRVLAFARPQQEEIGFERVDVDELVGHAIELSRPKWEKSQNALQRSIGLTVETTAAATINGNPGELREVLLNLIFNAVDAMPQGGHITVRTWSNPAGVFVAVRDTGAGMSEHTQHRLFEPLFTTKGKLGTGLGLSISFSMIQRHGGEISVQSTVGAGSTFTVRLPAASPASAVRRNNSPPPPAAPSSQGMRLLVIEDEGAVRSFLETALTTFGYRPRMAADGEEGLRFFNEEPFDLVMTDFSLPGINGEEVARTIFQRSPGTPVVLLTGDLGHLSTRIEPQQGITRVVGKPVKLSALATTLAEVMATR
ncbi:MAG: ATP-binding protein [Planctomycetota bacterium]